MAQPKQFSETYLARFEDGTFVRLDAVLSEGEHRADLIREAVERELNRRERQRDDYSAGSLADDVVSDPDILGGMPVIKGHEYLFTT